MKEFKLVAFDIETIGLGGDAIYCSWCDGGEPQGSIVNEPGYPSFTDYLLENVLTEKHKGHVIVAHNGLRFDYLRIDWLKLCELGFSGRFFTGKNKNNIRGIDLKYKRMTFKLRDSFTYCTQSLDAFARMFAGGETKGKIDFEKESFDNRNPEHIAYALQDARVLYNACKGFDDMQRERFGVTIMDSVTLSGLGFKAMKTKAKEEGYADLPYLNPNLENAVRSSYHGGFTSAFQVGKFKDLVYYDINSAYAYAMERYPMPGGPGMASVTKGRGINLCLCTVEFNDSFPYLISKPEEKKFSGRYSGRVIGWFWDFEIQLQRKLGAIIHEHSYICWDTTDTRLRSFIQMCKKLRMEDYHGPLGKLAKLMQNSVYGKCGAQKHETDLILAEDGGENSIPILDLSGEVVAGLWERPSPKKGPQGTLVHWASYITALVRYQLMTYLLEVPQEDWIYCDTDSFIIPSKYRKKFDKYCGDDYGQIKLEGELKWFELNAPKTYRGETKTGEEKKANKGIPKKRADEAWQKGTAHFEGARSLYYTMNGKLRNDFDNQYSRKTHRALSSPTSVSCGYYEGGKWKPKSIYAIYEHSTHCIGMQLPELIEREIKQVNK